jgi:hypothetical protein
MLALYSFDFSLILEISLSAMHCVTSSKTAASVIFKNRMCTMRGVVFEGGASLAQPLAPKLRTAQLSQNFVAINNAKFPDSVTKIVINVVIFLK